MSSILSAICCFGHSMNEHKSMSKCNAFVQPHINYSLPEWGNTYVTVSNKMNCTLLNCKCILFSNSDTTFTWLFFSSFAICDFSTEVLIHNILTMHFQIYATPVKHGCDIDQLLSSHKTLAQQL